MSRIKGTKSNMEIILYSPSHLEKSILDQRGGFQLKIVTVKPLISC